MLAYIRVLLISWAAMFDTLYNVGKSVELSYLDGAAATGRSCSEETGGLYSR